jgi:hypothetical protein
MELRPGQVYLSARAHEHIASDHASDYRLVIDTLAAAITEPTYLGQAPHHASNFEAIKRVAVTEEDEGGKILRRYYVLVAIRFEPDLRGDYRIVSAYSIKEEEANARRAAGRLLPPKK